MNRSRPMYFTHTAQGDTTYTQAAFTSWESSTY